MVSDGEIDDFGVHSLIAEEVVLLENENGSQKIVVLLFELGVGGAQLCGSRLFETDQRLLQYLCEFHVFLEEVAS